MRLLAAVNLAALILCVGACERKEASTPTPTPTPAPASNSAARAELPAKAFLVAAPADAKPVKEVKAKAKGGDKVVVVGRVGMSEEPFVKGRSVFTIVDLDVKYCGEVEKDSCSTPWDYCCEPSEVLAASSATVQFVGPNGQPVRAELNGMNGLKPLSIVSVVGTVAQGDGTNLVVNADSLYVKP